MPFSIIGSDRNYEVKGKQVPGRKYPWGVVEVLNEQYSDFVKMKTVLFAYFFFFFFFFFFLNSKFNPKEEKRKKKEKEKKKKKKRKKKKNVLKLTLGGTEKPKLFPTF